MSNSNLVLGILAHVDAGKTTLSEAILYKTGAIRKLGRVDHKTAFLDNNVVEQDRGITVFSKEARFSIGEKNVVLLDTPGHADFSTEAERTLQVLDYAILVISGADGVQSHNLTI
ncbi:MAG: GTP-binding protein, partial [Firmicutes bacterium]|nr:GTP-binding protein [Bacillota bacterium]